MRLGIYLKPISATLHCITCTWSMVPISKERENREEQDAVLFVRTKYDMVTLAIFLGVSRRIHYTYEHHTYMYQDQILFTFFLQRELPKRSPKKPVYYTIRLNKHSKWILWRSKDQTTSGACWIGGYGVLISGLNLVIHALLKLMCAQNCADYAVARLCSQGIGVPNG